ncbi:MAG TPA: hypothetical protein VN856_17310, partial [Mycobacterium sp.]|uniref:hypothetical protein n=1 Tax=Mycobacterium sp. TaxID=1785 RepID=UPI002D0A664C
MSTAETGGLMTSNRRTRCRVQQWSTGAGLLAAAAMIGMATAHADTDDPAVVPYSPDPSNVFSPVYTITPTGAEDVSVTDGAGDVFGTQDFTISELGFPVDTFTGNVEYTPTPFDEATGLSGILSQLSQEFGLPGGYSEEITTLGGTGTVLPDEPTSFLISEFGLGYGNVFEESMNSAGTSATVGDYILTPFGDENITPIVDLFLPQGVGITDAAGAV